MTPSQVRTLKALVELARNGGPWKCGDPLLVHDVNILQDLQAAIPALEAILAEPREAVAWVIKLRGQYQCVTADPLIKLARESDGFTSEPLYPSTPAAVSVEALEKLAEEWRKLSATEPYSPLDRGRRVCADEIMGLITAHRSPQGRQRK